MEATNTRNILKAYRASAYLGATRLGATFTPVRTVRTRKGERLAIIVTPRGVFVTPANCSAGKPGTYTWATYCGPVYAFSN